MIDLRVGEIALRITELERRLREILVARDRANEEYQERVYAAEQASGGGLKALNDDFGAATRAQATDHYERPKKQIREAFKARRSRIDKALSSCLVKSRAQVKREAESQAEALSKGKLDIADQIRPESDAAAEKLAWLRDRLAALRSKAEKLKEQVWRFAAKRAVHLPPDDEVQAAGEEWSPSLLDEDAETLAKELDESRRSLASTRRTIAAVLSNRVTLVLFYIVAVLAHAAAAGLVVHLSWSLINLAYIGLTLAATLLFLAGFSSPRIAKPMVAALNLLWVDVNVRLERLDRLGAVGEKELGGARYLEEQIGRILVLEQELDGQRKQTLGASDKVVSEIRERHQRLLKRIERQRDESLSRLEAEHGKEISALSERHRQETQRLETTCETRGEEARKGKDRTIEQLAAEWKTRLADLVDFCKRAMREFRQTRAALDERSGEELRLPDDFPRNVFVGTVHLDITQLAFPCDDEDPRFSLPDEKTVELPLALSFPTCGSLQIQAAGPARTRAIEALFGSVLRLLRSFPAGKIKLTLIDPVGLGESFAGLMQLSEYDEQLVRGRIWTEPAHIERKLADLTERIEKVIQTYLRNRYATIADYNRDAGQMTEPYEFVVIADFPTRFSDLALERLASVLTSGPRCGVYTLIHRGAKPTPAEEGDPENTLGNALLLSDDGNKLSVDHAGLRKGDFSGEVPPKDEALGELLDGIGKCSVEAQQVELPFDAIVPSPDETWSLSAENGIRVPIGRSGAERIQYLDLGRGTAQHALVGGRTGSGKSTLFHVIITATSLWFSPREVEFYLIDFKHGVEFKLFAAHRLPHARVIAIESDREFGLSVLQKINEELSRRGDMFRKAGVQDLAGYRRSAPDEYLPRTILLIDEFQEFFTEDDVIARDAALLLDRFVRQGRAFGIHVILGSQTLSGIYTLAKSTLGQMGVRIALQCNEADSQLILSEDNAAARLLSHSGEAIYNHMSGLLEGNSPFQVVWMPEDVQERYLLQLAARAEEEGERSAESTIVFEGNAPADLRVNPLLQELLAKGELPGGTSGRAWVGEASAIKGPTEVRFSRAGGSNLLIVGQNRQAAFATLMATLISLAAGHRAEDARFIVFDSEGQTGENAAHLAALADALGEPRLVIASLRDVEKILKEVHQEHIAVAEEEAARVGRRTYIIAFGLQRLRALRQEDSFSFSTGEEEGSSPGALFANLLREGPERGVHCIVWCDTLTNLSRALARSTLREFDLRILFQMSPADSSEICDSTVAGNLGLHKALLAVESDGTLEKFRPYTIPDAEWLEKVKQSLKSSHAE